MISRMCLLVTALAGSVLFAASADESAPSRQPQDTKTSAMPNDKPVAPPASTQTLAEKVPESTWLAGRRISPDADAIRLVGDSFVKAYEAGDASAVAEHFTTDAEYVDETGTVFEGREAIEASMKDFFAVSPVCRLQIDAGVNAHNQSGRGCSGSLNIDYSRRRVGSLRVSYTQRLCQS